MNPTGPHDPAKLLKKKTVLFIVRCIHGNRSGKVRQAGPVFYPALGIRISQRFSDVRKVGWSCSPTERH